MGTTIVGAVINEERCTIFNVGDSRAYWIHDAGMIQVSEDDVYPGERTGILAQCLGAGNPAAPKPHHFQQDIRSGDTLVLVSDGITDAISDDVIKSVVSERSSECSFKLCEEAKRLGGSDDASAIICQFS
jgi:protein phosphatase